MESGPAVEAVGGGGAGDDARRRVDGEARRERRVGAEDGAGAVEGEEARHEAPDRPRQQVPPVRVSVRVRARAHLHVYAYSCVRAWVLVRACVRLLMCALYVFVRREC